MMAMRVVSLVPSVTETLVRWGVPPIACTRFCEQPDLRHVGGTKNPDIEAITALSPDVVVMCEEENRREDAEALAAAGVMTAALSIEGLDDVPPAMGMLAGVVGLKSSLAIELTGEIREARASARSGGTGLALRAFIPIWKRPWMSMAADTYGSSLLEALGVTNVYADADDRYPETSLEEAATREPDVVLAPSEPYPFRERHVELLSQVAPVVLVDGQDLFWWGARTPDALRRLGRALTHAVSA